MFKMLEKLINEHGSANILSERLGLKDDQIATIQGELSVLIQENTNLKSENGRLNNLLDQAKQEIASFQKIINSNAESQASNKLHKVEIQILKQLFDTNGEFTSRDISMQFSLNIGNAEFHLNHLLEHSCPVNLNDYNENLF